MEPQDAEKRIPTKLLLEKLGRGIRILSENVETPRLPGRMTELLARLESNRKERAMPRVIYLGESGRDGNDWYHVLDVGADFEGSIAAVKLRIRDSAVGSQTESVRALLPQLISELRSGNHDAILNTKDDRVTVEAIISRLEAAIIDQDGISESPRIV